VVRYLAGKHMSNPQTYCIYERTDGKFAVTGQGNRKPSRVLSTEVKAESKAHRLAGRYGTVVYGGTDGKFESDCPCARCKQNKGYRGTDERRDTTGLGQHRGNREAEWRH